MTAFVEWLGAVPTYTWAALAGTVSARVLTWIAERKRNRDAYRPAQREAIGAIIAAANDMKVSQQMPASNLRGRSRRIYSPQVGIS
jgi:hypothetical protein